MNSRAFLTRATLAFSLVFSLTGCASVFRVDNQVESFASWTSTPPNGKADVPAPPQHYRFERLPSQTLGAAAQSQDALEQWTQDVLAALGWTLVAPGDKASWTVQVAGQNNRLPRAPWEEPWGGDRFPWSGHVIVGVGGGPMMWSPWLLQNDIPYYQRQVSMVIREGNSGRVVYETRAAHDGRWSSSPALWKAMLSAALTDFPTSSPGIREINIDVPR